jgi:phenylalanyl-tRNA synthetase alpha chain
MMLSENEQKIISFLKTKGVSNSQEISSATGLPPSTVFSNLKLLESKGLVKILKEERKKLLFLTEEGRKRLVEGLPEEKLMMVLGGQPRKIEEVKEKMKEDFEIALGWARKRGWIEIDGDLIKPIVKEIQAPERDSLRALSKGQGIDHASVELLLKRKLVERREDKILEVELIKDVEAKPVEIYLTHEMLVSGDWEKREFKEYNVEADPPFLPIGRTHYFRDFIERVKDLMVSLGFSEVSSDYVELEFFNFDVLFQPQDHPAREIHDSFVVKGKGRLPPGRLVEEVKKTHETWWKYRWSPEVASNLVMRSQTTATTSRVLSRSPGSPLRVFTIGKVFRPDAIDATHLIEFHQMDGLVIEEGFNFRSLLSILREIFRGLGVKEVKFKPGYFPFTEPSVEVYGYVDPLGWVEMAGAGLLRREVTSPAGVSEPAGAWGIGIDRLVMLFLGVKDIRDLYSSDIEYLRHRRVV